MLQLSTKEVTEPNSSSTTFHPPSPSQLYLKQSHFPKAGREGDLVTVTVSAVACSPCHATGLMSTSDGLTIRQDLTNHIDQSRRLIVSGWSMSVDKCGQRRRGRGQTGRSGEG